MPTRSSSRRPSRVPARALLAAALLCAVAPAGLAGTWTRLIHNAPGKVNGLVLLGDGTVMAAKNNGSTIGSGWFRLKPDASGSYVNGTWTTLAAMHDTRLYYATQVMKDGRVFVAGGEYGTGGPHAEVYNPQNNTWTQVDPPSSLWNTAADSFVDSISDMLENGRVLIMPVAPHNFGVALLYDPATNSWSQAGALKHNISNQSEATWAKLPDHSILSVDPFSTKSQRYFEDTNTWLGENTVPVALYDSFVGELGGGLMLSTGQAIFLGASGHTALYAPTGSTLKGTWTAGPDFPNGQGTPDAPAAMMVNGKVLCATSLTPSAGNNFPSPTSFYEYDPIANSFAQVNGPNGLTDGTSTFPTAMLCLPDGTVMYSHMGADTYVYQPGGAPLVAGKPAITGITHNLDGTWHLTGTGLNGLSEGASYGDDLQLNSNYPLVRLSSGTNVWYARSFGWSSTGVMTGATPVSTEFATDGIPPGDYTLVVSASGLLSDPVPFTQPAQAGWIQLGSGLAGLLGIPNLSGIGSLVGGLPAEIDLSLARPASIATLFVGTSNNPTPFKGGFLVPVPFLTTVPFVTDVTGGIILPFSWPTGLPSGFNIYFQYGIQDFVAVKGVALSNALQATTP